MSHLCKGIKQIQILKRLKRFKNHSTMCIVGVFFFLENLPQNRGAPPPPPTGPKRVEG
jgi:hypothetical protein